MIFLTLLSSTDNHVELPLAYASSTFPSAASIVQCNKDSGHIQREVWLCPQLLGGNLSYMTEALLLMGSPGHTLTSPLLTPCLWEGVSEELAAERLLEEGQEEDKSIRFALRRGRVARMQVWKESVCYKRWENSLWEPLFLAKSDCLWWAVNRSHYVVIKKGMQWAQLWIAKFSGLLV